MKTSVLLFLSFLLLISPPLYAQNLEDIFTKENKLVYKDYEVATSFDASRYGWVATLKKSGKVVSLFAWGENVGVPGSDWISFGLYSFLGGKEPQLILGQTAMCARCGAKYWIVNLSPDFEIIYQSEDYPGVNGFDLLDLNRDGVLEFTSYLETFSNFERLSYAQSPFLLLIFQYDPKAKKYLPANPKFPDYTLEGIDKDVQDFKKFNERTDFAKYEDAAGEYLSSALKVILKYIYTGKEKEAWAFFDKEYQLKDKEEIRLRIKEKLVEDAVYKYIYGR